MSWLNPRAQRARSKRGRRLAASMLPYARHIDDATLICHDGQLVQILHLSGLPFETADTEDLNYRKVVRDTMFRGVAHPRLSIYHHVVRQRVEPRCEGVFENAFASRLDEAWRERIAGRRLFANELFLTLVLRPALTMGAGGFGRNAQSVAAGQARSKRDLEAARDTIVAALAPYGARLLTTYEADEELHSEPIEFLSCLFNGEWRPNAPQYSNISRDIPWRRVSFGGDVIEYSAADGRPRAFAAAISIKEYPPHTVPGEFDGLYRAPYEMTVTHSFAFVDRQSALNRMNLTLRRMRAADDEALSLRRDLADAKDDVAAGRAAFGEHHMSVVVKASTLGELDDAVAEAQAALNEAGIIGVRETQALEPAFWAQFPAAAAFIPRRALISSSNFASISSCHNHPRGVAAGNHWGPAATVFETTSGSAYYFSFHKGDLGNFLVIGPSGSGKTVVLNFLLAQAQKFAPRLAFFDKDRGAEIFIRALDGQYDSIRPGVRTGFNPLQLPDTSLNRRFLQAWLERLLSSNGEVLSADDGALIGEAIAANFEQRPQLRRLRYLRELLVGVRRPAAGDLATRLAPWVGDGERAWLFDNEVDRLTLDSRNIGFDMTLLLEDPAIRTPTMMYLFHRVEERLDGSPTIIVVDEGWKALDDDVFVARIRDWEKTIRKRNGIIGFCTQSARDALDSKIASAIVEQSATQIFLPNPRAQEEDYCDGFGLSRHEFQLIKTLPDTSRCFLIKHGADSVIARLNLNGADDILAVLSGRERSVRLLDELRAAGGDDPAVWLPQLLARER